MDLAGCHAAALPVKCGRRMRADMLDINMDEVTRTRAAPLQMKANNGIR